MKLLKFLQVARKQGADISRLTIRVSNWHGVWSDGIRVVSLRGNRMVVSAEKTFGDHHRMELVSGHDVYRCDVASVSTQHQLPRRLSGKSSSLILDLTTPVDKEIEW